MRKKLKEPTKCITFRVPKSKEKVLKTLISSIVKEWHKQNKADERTEPKEIKEIEDKPNFYGELFPE